MIQDAPLYAVNMFYYHWLIKNLLWPMAGQNIARREIQTELRRKKAESVRCQQPLEKMPEHDQQATEHVATHRLLEMG